VKPAVTLSRLIEGAPLRDREGYQPRYNIAPRRVMTGRIVLPRRRA
jgi:hypothetical protein